PGRCPMATDLPEARPACRQSLSGASVARVESSRCWGALVSNRAGRPAENSADAVAAEAHGLGPGFDGTTGMHRDLSKVLLASSIEDRKLLRGGRKACGPARMKDV